MRNERRTKEVRGVNKGRTLRGAKGGSGGMPVLFELHQKKFSEKFRVRKGVLEYAEVPLRGTEGVANGYHRIPQNTDGLP